MSAGAETTHEDAIANFDADSSSPWTRAMNGDDSRVETKNLRRQRHNQQAHGEKGRRPI